MQDTVCCGCSVVCDDVTAGLNRSKFQSLGLCRLGHEYCSSVQSKTRLIKPLIKKASGKHVASNLNESLLEATQLLQQSKKPLVIGWSNSPIEAIDLGLDLTEKVKGVFDTTASFEYFQLHKFRLIGDNPKGLNLDEVRNKADHIIYWGVNPAESHHRHASRYTIFPKGEEIPEGRESRIISVIDIRETESMRLANHQLILDPETGDLAFLNALIDEIEGRSETLPTKVGGIPPIEFLSFAKQLREAEYTAIFYGNGLIHAPLATKTLPLLAKLIRALNRNRRRAASLPMVAYCNTVGAVIACHKKTRLPFSIDFTSKPPKPYGSIFEGLGNSEFDCALIIGWDAMSLLPGPVVKALNKIPIIAFATHPTLTTQSAQVVIPTALTGAETEGTVYRMDGIPVKLKPFIKPKSDIQSEHELLKQLITNLG